MKPTDLGQHIHHRFDRELESLRNRVVAMGGLVERQVNDALTALTEQNTELAEYVIRTDHRVNAQEVSIDEDCTYILARRQPAAGGRCPGLVGPRRQGDGQKRRRRPVPPCCCTYTARSRATAIPINARPSAQLNRRKLT